MDVAPALVAQRMTDLLQCFPAAAIGGVQWCTLVRKYEEKHGVLSLERLGFSSALGAATALLWDSLRIVDRSDTTNPVVAVEDAVALTPSPSGLASWPSLYKVLCEIACSQGEAESTPEADSHIVLLSKVKPLLQRHWHSNFDELGLAYLTEEGSTVKLKKMKHLLQALLRWKGQYAEWRAERSASGCAEHGACGSELDAALEMELLLEPAKARNDLTLRCVRRRPRYAPPEHVAASMAAEAPCDLRHARQRPAVQLDFPARPRAWADISDWEDEPGEAASTTSRSDRESSAGFSTASAGFASSAEEELAFLRAENAKLHFENHALHTRAAFNQAFLHFEHPKMEAPDPFEDFDLDDPSEPPPPLPRYRYLAHSPACSTAASLGYGSGFASGSQTPFSECSSIGPYGCTSPMHGHAQQGAAVQAMPMWFQIIPTGLVQEARAVFGGTSVPSWFANQTQVA